MSDEGGKKLGLVGGGLAAIGLLFARTADDCGRAGSRVARAGGELGAVTRTADDWAPRAGRFADEIPTGRLGRPSTHGWGHGVGLGLEGGETRWAHGLGGDEALHPPAALADDFAPSAARGGHPDGDVLADAVEIGADVALDVASNLPDDEPAADEPALDVLLPVPGPRVIALLPIDEMEGVAMYGAASSTFIDGFRDTLAAVASSPNAASLAFRLRRAAELDPPPPLVIVGYTNELGYRLDGGELATEQIRDRCGELGLRCVMVTCPGPTLDDRCGADALGAISRSLMAMGDAQLEPRVAELRLRSSLAARLGPGAQLVAR